MRLLLTQRIRRRSGFPIVAAVCLCLLPTAFSGDDIIQQVQDQTFVDVGFDHLESGPHNLTMTLQAAGGATAIDYSDAWDPNGTILWTSTDNFTSAFEHHWTANGVTGNDVVTPEFSGYTNDGVPPMPYGFFHVAVSHIDIDLDDGSGGGGMPPMPGEPDPADEAESSTGVGTPITFNGPDLPAVFPFEDETGRTLTVNITSSSGGTLYFDGTGNQLAVYRMGGTGWEKIAAGTGITVPAGGLFDTYLVHTSNQFTGPVDLKARLEHTTSALDAADVVKVVYDGSAPGPLESTLNLAADTDNNNFNVQYRPPEYTQEEEDEEENPGMKMHLTEGWAKIELNAADFGIGNLTLTHDDSAGKFEFADAGFTIISSSPIYDAPVDASSFNTLVFYVRPKQGIAADGDEVTLTADLTDGGQRRFLDKIKIKLKGVIVDLDIFNGQGAATAVQEKNEETIGAFTVANMNDTNGDGTPDNDPTQSPVAGEKNLMKLIVWKPFPDTGGSVTLQFASQYYTIGSAVKLWTDSAKTSPITLVDGAATFATSTLSTAAGGWFRKEVWVELPADSPVVRDITATLTYTTVTDKVAATGIWAVQTGFKNKLTDTLWADAGDPLKTTFATILGSKLGINFFAPSSYFRYSMAMEFRVSPSETSAQWKKWNVVFDITRQIEYKDWEIDGGIVKPAGSNLFPSGDTANDDGGADSHIDEDATPTNDHIYVIDGPGEPSNGAHDQVVSRNNFYEYVRIRFDGSTLAGNNSNGSRCSNKIPWHVFYWVEKDGTKYKQRAGKTNEVKEGHLGIGGAPSP